MRMMLVLAMGVVSSVGWAGELKRLSLDDAAAVSPRIEVDQENKVEGTGSLKIETERATVVWLGEIVGPEVENAQLMYTAQVKTDLEGTAFLEMIAQVGGGEYFSKGMNEAVGQKTDWKTIRTPFVFQKGQKPEKITLNLVINGKGTVWIDDIVLATEALK